MEPEQPRPSGLTPILAVGLFGLATLGCLIGLLGPALLPVLLAVAGLALVGSLHYWLWGHALTEKLEAEEKDSPES